MVRLVRAYGWLILIVAVGVVSGLVWWDRHDREDRLARFDRLGPGMTVAEVELALGRPADSVEDEPAGPSSAACEYRTWQYRGDVRIKVKFIAGRLAGKAYEPREPGRSNSEIGVGVPAAYLAFGRFHAGS